MPEIDPSQLLEQLEWRYAVKRFDPQRKLDATTWSALEQAMVLTPSSYGLQPWKFIVITDQRVKDQLPAMSWNQKQPQDCSHMVVMAARKTMDVAHIDRYMNSVVTTRSLEDGAMDGYRKTLVGIVEKMPNHLDWNARQVYIALGQLMVSAAMLGVDTCPMEGIDTAAFDELLGLSDTEFTTVVGCAVGYRHPDDVQATAAKVRFSRADLLVEL
jgi:nitroreductase